MVSESRYFVTMDFAPQKGFAVVRSAVSLFERYGGDMLLDVNHSVPTGSSDLVLRVGEVDSRHLLLPGKHHAMAKMD